MKKPLNGRQGKLAIRIDGVFYDVLCAIEVSFQFDHEEILKTSRNSGRFIERETRLCDWGINISGLTKIDDADGQIGFFYLLQQAGTEQYVRMRYTDSDGNIQNVYGYVLIKQGQLAGVVSGFSTASLFLPGTGAYDMDNVAGFSPTDIFHLYLTTTPGAYEVSDNDLGSITEIMMVIRETRLFTEVSGTPVGRQFKFVDNTTYGTIQFDNSVDTGLPFEPGEIVYVQYKKPV